MSNETAISRGYGRGSIMLRGKVYYLRYQVNGKMKWESLKTGDLEEAKVNANVVLPASLATAESKAVVAAHIGDAKQLIASVNTLRAYP